jgi:hypothetical protein
MGQGEVEEQVEDQGQVQEQGQMQEAQDICSYNKQIFNTKLDVLRDAHAVTSAYAKLLLEGKFAAKLDKYTNYSDATEEYFNPTRKQVLSNLGSSYYQFYQYINSLKSVYEKTELDETSRRQIVLDVFNKCIIVQKYLIEDLWDDCNKQGGLPA